MQNCTTWRPFIGPKVTKLIPLLMRLAMFMTLAVSLHLPARAVSQDEKLNLSEKQIRLDRFFRLLEKKTDYRFTYSTDVIPVDKRIDVVANREPVLSLLGRVLVGCGFSYRVLGEKTVVIIPLSEATEKDRLLVAENEVSPPPPLDTVRGLVLGKDGLPLEGASVAVKGTSNGTVTSGSGAFVLYHVGDKFTLVVSHVGYESQEIGMNGKLRFDITLKEIQTNLNDVVVLGYTTQKRTDITGSVTTLESKDVDNSSVSNLLQAMQGKVPGLLITQGSGQPGNEDVSMTLRGPNSFVSDNTPLVLINGVVGDIGDLDPSFIESISVLKDASAASIYGARASNGVILITTKTGARESRLSVRYTGSFIHQSEINEPNRVWNSVQYMTMFDTAMNHSGAGQQEYGADTIALYQHPSKQYPSFNWQKFMIRPLDIFSHSLSIGGRSGNTNFEGGMGIWNQDGIVPGFNYKKYTGMFNLESQITKGLKFGITTNILVDNQLQPYIGGNNEIYYIIGQLPDYQPYPLNGSGYYANRAWDFELAQTNPLVPTQNGLNQTTDVRFNGTAYTQLNILKNLTWEVKGALFYSEGEYKQQTPVVPLYNYQTGVFFEDAYNNETISLTDNITSSPYYTLYSTLKYQAAFGNGFHLGVLAGISQESSTTTTLSGYRYGFASNALTALSAGPAQGQTNSGDVSKYALRSQFGQVNLDYQSKYLVEASFRRDGSSRFPPANKYAFFPSVSVGWRLSQESFIRNAAPWLTELKIRASDGILGNDNVNGNYPYQNVIGTGANYPFAGNLDGGIVANTLANPHLKWEQTSIKNVGFDYNIARNMVYGSLEYFVKSTSGILRQEQVPGYAGVNGPYVNEGQVDNKGPEIVIGHKGHINAFTYGAEFNIAAYRNKLVKFGAPEIGGASMLKEGYEMNVYYMYEADGIYQSQKEVADGPKTPWTAAPGDVRIKDVDGDGSITPNDRVAVKGANPNYYYGLNLTGSWKGFDLTIFFQGSQGEKILANLGLILPFETTPMTYWLNAWTPENHSTTVPSLTNAGGSLNASTKMTSTFWLENTSYMRLKNLTIGYTLPRRMTKKVYINNLRLFARGENLLTFTRYKFGDPETGGNGSYPMLRSLTLGLNVQF